MTLPNSPEELFEQIGEQIAADHNPQERSPLSQKISKAIFTEIVKDSVDDLTFYTAAQDLIMLWRDLNVNNLKSIHIEATRTGVLSHSDINHLLFNSRLDSILNTLLDGLEEVLKVSQLYFPEPDDMLLYSIDDEA
jgi:hypothetical protein